VTCGDRIAGDRGRVLQELAGELAGLTAAIRPNVQ
jgi:hypothetical protein